MPRGSFLSVLSVRGHDSCKKWSSDQCIKSQLKKKAKEQLLAEVARLVKTQRVFETEKKFFRNF